MKFINFSIFCYTSIASFKLKHITVGATLVKIYLFNSVGNYKSMDHIVS